MLGLCPALVAVLPEGWKRTDLTLPEFPPREFLLWFVPLSIMSAFTPIFYCRNRIRTDSDVILPSAIGSIAGFECSCRSLTTKKA